MKTLVETITPKKAKDLLEKNTHNRPVSNKRVDHYASLMKAGKWHLTHQGIAISKTDVIIDGQHRLLAVVQANMPIDFSITYGVEDETFKFVEDRKSTRLNYSHVAISYAVFCLKQKYYIIGCNE